MRIDRIRALRGPNLWGRHTALELVVSLEPAEESLDGMPGFEARLRSRFPQIGPIRPIGHMAPLPAAQALRFATLRLQSEAGSAVTFSHCTPTIEPRTYRVVVEYAEEAVGRLALDLAQALYRAALDDTAFDLRSALARLRALDEDVSLGPSTGAIVRAAADRGVPVRRLTDGSLVQLGWGSRQKRIQAAEIDATSAIAESIAQDKELTKRLLGAAGIPVPAGRCVSTLEEAQCAMEALGGPVAVKPRDGNQGKGVTVNVSTPEHLAIAFRAAQEFGREIIVERFVPGHDHRLLVVGNRLIAAARREPPHVIGDGEHTIRALVDRVNQDPKRGDGHATPLTRIRLDEIAEARLRIQGYRPDDVPPRGARVVLRNNANLSTGGTATDVTDDVHPELARRVVEAATAVGLDICGVDVVCTSVGEPLEAQNGAVVEVNAAPGLRMHLAPSYGHPRNVGGAVVDLLFGAGDDGRIPVVAITGTNGKTISAHLVAAMLTATGQRVGMAGSDGLRVGSRWLARGDCSDAPHARDLLSHPEVDAAVLEVSRGGILGEGLGFDRCGVAIVTNVGSGDHLGLDHLETVEELAVLKRVIVQNMGPDGVAVLNAADPNVAAMRAACPGSVIHFARDGTLAVMTEQRARGQRLVTVEAGHVVACHGPREHWRLPLSRIPLTLGGAAGFMVDNVLAAVGAAWALGIAWPLVEATLTAAVADTTTLPGRLNLFRHRGATVLADRGHNADALLALTDTLDAMALPGRRTLVMGIPADRREHDVRTLGRVAADRYDRIILCRDAGARRRGRSGLARDDVEHGGRARQVELAAGEPEAIDAGLVPLAAGDVCVVLLGDVDAGLARLAARVDGV